MLWTIIGWIVFGLIVGFIARALVPGRDAIGVLRTIALGVVGSVLGGFVFGLLTVRVPRFPAGRLDRLDRRRRDRAAASTTSSWPAARRRHLSP